ncbi:MAG: hypothetical protein F4029_06565 [Gammaproteobacteria bacterium]|nr:hypothetical protein [Gammaproteobacteria bacterium]
MADYHIQCELRLDATACAALADRLEALESPGPEDRLALLWARRSLAGLRGEAVPKGDFCAGVTTLAADHPDYTDALHNVALFCTADLVESTALLVRALQTEPGNYGALSSLVSRVHGPAGGGFADLGVAPEDLEKHREALYEAALIRAKRKASAYPRDFGSRYVWQELFVAARYMIAEAQRVGDPDAAAAVGARVLRDAGLDALDFDGVGECSGDGWSDCQRGSRGDNLALACQPLLYEDLGLEEVCLSAVEKLAASASADGLTIPHDVLHAVESATHELRRVACAATQGIGPAGLLVLSGDECRGAEATETASVARLRAVLEHHAGAWSSEHYRVHANGFLGDDRRLDGLRAAVRAHPENEQARCELATALAARGASAEATALGGDPECLERRDFAWGDTVQDPQDPRTHAISFPRL